MNPLLLVATICIAAFISRGDPNSATPRNASLVSACIGETVKLAQFPKDKCGDERLDVIVPNGTKVQRNIGRLTMKNSACMITDVQPSNTGTWTCRRYCNENIQEYKTYLEVNCNSLFVAAKSDLPLKCPKPPILANAKNVTMMMYCELSYLPDKVIILKYGKITKKAQKTFGERVSVGLDGHTLNIYNIKTTDTGNYTCLWRWGDVNKASRTFTHRINVTVVKEPLTTQPPVVSLAWNTSSEKTTSIPSAVTDRSGLTDVKEDKWILASLLICLFVSGQV